MPRSGGNCSIFSNHNVQPAPRHTGVGASRLRSGGGQLLDGQAPLLIAAQSMPICLCHPEKGCHGTQSLAHNVACAPHNKNFFDERAMCPAMMLVNGSIGVTIFSIIEVAHLDAGAVGRILSEFIDTSDWMPLLHSRAEDIGFAGTMIDRGWVRVFEGHNLGLYRPKRRRVCALCRACSGGKGSAQPCSTMQNRWTKA